MTVLGSPDAVTGYCRAARNNAAVTMKMPNTLLIYPALPENACICKVFKLKCQH